MNRDLTQLLVTELNLDPEKLLPDAGLDEAGLDSLGIVELSTTLAEQWGVEIGHDELATVTTLDALDRLVGERLAERCLP